MAPARLVHGFAAAAVAAALAASSFGTLAAAAPGAGHGAVKTAGKERPPWTDSASFGSPQRVQQVLRHGDMDDDTETHDKHKPLDPTHVPQYVIDHAPLVYLHSEELFWPCHVAQHLEHVAPYLDWAPLVNDSGRHHGRYGLDDLAELNEYRMKLYLTSDDNVEDRPPWLFGDENRPGQSPDKDGSDQRPGYSDAPVAMFVVDKGHGVVDAFYHFFYCYNLGNKVLNVRFGNHVGDWEHFVVRFKHGKPIQVFFSEHAWGEAFTWDAVEKIGKRPVAYSAIGTHAMYPTAGVHRYVLPWGLLSDHTDTGPLWDPLLNVYSYHYNATAHVATPNELSPRAPVGWFYFGGHWGDKAYRLDDGAHKQYFFAGQRHYVSGPTGPIQKNLGRKDICIREGVPCAVQEHIVPAGAVRSFIDGHVLGPAEVAAALEAAGGLDELRGGSAGPLA